MGLETTLVAEMPTLSCLSGCLGAKGGGTPKLPRDTEAGVYGKSPSFLIKTRVLMEAQDLDWQFLVHYPAAGEALP